MARTRKEFEVRGTARTSAARRGLKDLQKGTQKAGKSAGEASGRFASLSGRLRTMDNRLKRVSKTMDITAKAAGAAALGGAVIGLVKGFDAMMMKSAQSQGVMKNLQVSIAGARKVTRGWITDLELARNANRATDLGIAKSAKDFEALAAGAFAASRRLGIDATDAMDDLTSAIANNSKLRLDNLGVMIDTERANREFAASIGKTADALTDVEKSTAFQTEAMRQLREAAENTDTSVDAMTDSWMRGKVAMENWATETGPAVLGWIGRMMEGIFRLDEALDVLINGVTKTTNIRDVRGLLEAREKQGLGTDPILAAAREEEAASQAVTEQAELLAKVQQDRAKMADIGKSMERLAQTTAKGGFKPKKRRGGGKDEVLKLTEFDLLSEEEQLAQMAFRDAVDPEQLQELEAFHRSIQEEVREHELAKADILLSERQRSIEMMRDAGVEPMQLINEEEAARVALLDKQLEFAETQIERDQLLNEIEQTHHDARMKRIQEEKRAIQERLRVQMFVTRETSALIAQTTQTAQIAAEAGVISERTAGGIAAWGASFRAAITATEQTIQAVASFASQNYGQGAAHAAAATFATVQSVLLASKAANMGHSGAFSVGTGAGGLRGSFGGTGGTGSGNNVPQGGGSGDRPDVPGSRPGDSPPPVPSGGGRGDRNVTVNVTAVTAQTEEELGLNLKRLIKDTDQKMGAVTV